LESDETLRNEEIDNMSMRYSDKELEKMMDDSESDLAKRKEAWSGDSPDKARQAVCALANHLPGHRKPGVLFSGVKGDGTPVCYHQAA
jgi:ATP-dependent DNA helicase RecG